MSKKRLVLVRDTNELRIFDEDAHLEGTFYTVLLNVTGLKRIGAHWYDIYSDGKLIGFASEVIEVKEEW